MTRVHITCPLGGINAHVMRELHDDSPGWYTASYP
jgi:hypothetical protein